MAAERRSGAESSRKVLGLLLAFDERRHTLTASQLAEAIDAPLSSTYRYLSVLRDSGLLEEAEASGSYRLTSRVIGMARAARVALGGLERLARPVLERIAAESGETALLVRRVGTVAVCVDRAESPHPVRLQFDPGQPMPLHLGSAARVLLSGMPAGERDAYLARLGGEGAGAGGSEPRVPGAQEIAAVAQTGWTQSFEEVDEGIWGAAAAVREQGRLVASLGVAGPLFRLGEQERERVIGLVRRGAVEIGVELDRLR
ncbi:IclR family transcriptional regulator [Nocardiopsis algeriensis]|uniref:DNA-binding IclR family transcriptional regulator n=1 Tax=Nocardiopsis algeriensis TaxID=1478215 RepID=A0A841ISE9_9ACTN|nr:IclR family transcriptional regulator [Nocardiopsis algeriensis]MBB6119535.1 DNA-binding IclR family transcriptional regulator [Nocardiopsis algeriensis]